MAGTKLTDVFLQGTHAARPAAAATNTGYYYFETDTLVLFQSTGSAWQALTPGQSLGTLGYAQVTASQGSITGVTDITGLSVPVTVVSGRRIRITVQINTCLSTTATDLYELNINEGATLLNTINGKCNDTANGLGATVHAIIQPSAGSHTYKAQLGRLSGSGTLTMGAGAVFPAFILVEDIGT